MPYLYGHNPRRSLTKNEELVLQYLDDVFRPASSFRKYIKHLNKESVSVALVRLRNRGLAESMEQESDKNALVRVRLWRRKEE